MLNSLTKQMMKMKYIYKVALLLPALVGLSACNEEMELSGAKQGGLNLSSLGVEVSNIEKVVNSRAVTDVSAYKVDVYRVGEVSPVESYVYGSMPGIVTLAPGDYYVNVRSHEIQKAEWDRPYFEGTSEQFTIAADKITEVGAVKCTFSSLKVSVYFGEKLRAKMGNDVSVTVVANDEGKLTYTPDDSRAGYFATIEGSTTLVATFTGTVNGHFENFSRTYTDVAAGQHRKITFEVGAEVPVPDAPSGSINPGDGIKVDISYVDEDLNAEVDPGNEEVIDPGETPGKLPDLPGEGDDPIVTPPGPDNPEEPAFDFAGSTLEDGKTYMNTDFDEAKPAKVIINCPEGIAKADVIIDSDFLTAEELEGVGLAKTFDLCDPKDLRDGLEGLGFPCGENIVNKSTAEVNVTDFMPLLGAGAGSTSKFTFTITDNKGNVKVTTFTIKVA